METFIDIATIVGALIIMILGIYIVVVWIPDWRARRRLRGGRHRRIDLACILRELHKK